MTPISLTFEETVTLTKTIEYLKINERLVCARVTTSGELVNWTSEISEKHFAKPLATSFFDVILTNENLALLLAGGEYQVEKLHAVSNEFLESASTKGFTQALEGHRKEFNKKTPVFDELFLGNTVNLVNIDHGGHMLFDDAGGVLPTSIPFSYISGNFRDGAYDMDKALAILENNPSVIPFGSKKLTIQEVPYYNRSPGCSTHIQFSFAPSQAEMTAIWDWAVAKGTKYPSTILHAAVFSLDLLGLRAGGAALGTTYGYTKEYPVTEEDDSDY